MNYHKFKLNHNTMEISCDKCEQKWSMEMAIITKANLPVDLGLDPCPAKEEHGNPSND